MIFFGERSLRNAVGQFLLHYHGERNHQGLGNKIITDEWRGQFIGAPARRTLVVVKSGAAKPGEIDAVTGATISSKAVTDIINTAVVDLREPLITKAKGM